MTAEQFVTSFVVLWIPESEELKICTVGSMLKENFSAYYKTSEASQCGLVVGFAETRQVAEEIVQRLKSHLDTPMA